MTPTPKRPAVVRWTSAKRPPSSLRDVNVYESVGGSILTGFYDGYAWIIYGLGGDWHYRVTHWRPLPPPPRQRLARPAQRKGKRK